MSPRKSLLLLYLVTQSCPTLCGPMDCDRPDSSVLGDSPGKDTEVGCHILSQGIFPVQGSNSCFPHCRWILYHLCHRGSPRIQSGLLIPPPEDFLTQELNWGFLNSRWIHYQRRYQGIPINWPVNNSFIGKMFPLRFPNP